MRYFKRIDEFIAGVFEAEMKVRPGGISAGIIGMAYQIAFFDRRTHGDARVAAMRVRLGHAVSVFNDYGFASAVIVARGNDLAVA